MFSLPLILLGVAVLLVFWGITLYNRFVKMFQQVKEAWASIDVFLKQRYDLIPNLVETVKGYASHERGTLDEVISARAQATQIHVDPANLTPETIAAMAAAETGLSQALGKLLAVAEAYPDLKANTNFLELQRELSDIENKIQSSRRFYNGIVRDFNTLVQQFPSNIVARMFGFIVQTYFELNDEAQREVPKVQF